MTTLDHSGALTTEQVKAVKQSTVLSASSPDSVQETAQGRHAFALWGPSQVAATLASTGAPIAVASLPSAQILNGPGYGIVKDAPHPLAAELLGAYYLTKPAQELIAKTSYNYGTLPGASAPSGFPDLSHYAYKTLPAGQFNDLLGDFHSRVTEKIFGKVS
jgi:ABC-type Fe3+ transport system substrate-binding protein